MGSGCRAAAWRLFDNPVVGIVALVRPRWALDHEEYKSCREIMNMTQVIGGLAAGQLHTNALFVVQPPMRNLESRSGLARGKLPRGNQWISSIAAPCLLRSDRGFPAPVTCKRPVMQLG